MDPLTVKHRRQLFALRAKTIRELSPLWKLWDPADAASWPRFAVPAAALISRRSREAADMGATYYRAMRIKTVGNAPRYPTLPPPVPHGAIEASLEATGLAGTFISVRNGFPLSSAKALAYVRMTRAAGRHVINGARRVVTSEAKHDAGAAGWKRLTAGTCDFCSELEAAGTGHGDLQAHDGCACVAEPQFNQTPKQLDQWAMKQFAAKLTEEQAQAVFRYTSEGDYALFNDALRYGEDLSPGLYEDLDAAIDQSVLKEDTTMFRGLGELPEGFERGATFTDEGFMSTSLNPAMAEEFSDGQWVIEIRAPAGSRGLYVREGMYDAETTGGTQNEMILPRGTKLQVRAINEDAHRAIVEVVK